MIIGMINNVYAGNHIWSAHISMAVVGCNCHLILHCPSSLPNRRLQFLLFLTDL